MNKLIIAAFCGLILFSGCSVSQSRFRYFDKQYPSLAEDAPVDVFETGAPTREFVKIARLDVHLEKSHFVSSSFKNALPLLKQQARRCGANGIIEIKEHTSTIGETQVYHVIATGIRYTD